MKFELGSFRDDFPLTQENLASAAVDGNPVAFDDPCISKPAVAILLVDPQRFAAHNARLAHVSCHQRGVGSAASNRRQDAGGG